MTIGADFWASYTQTLASISKKASDLMADYIDRNGLEDMAALILYAYGLVQRYGEASAELACECYDMLADAAGAIVPEATPAEVAEYSEVAEVVNGALNQSLIGAMIPSAIYRLIKQASQDTTLQNAARDAVMVAWVPVGDTCPFCIELAGEGYRRVPRSFQNGGHARHIHGNCDCAYVVKFAPGDSLAGYDPDRYFEMFENADGDTRREKLNAMRRDAYAENRERILEQKRSAYARREALESPEAEEVDV